MLCRALTTLAAGLVLAGCASQSTSTPNRDEAPEPPTVTRQDDACGSQEVQGYVGEPMTQALGKLMEEESGARTLRVMEPGKPYTKEFRHDRLGVSVDESGVIQSIRCG